MKIYRNKNVLDAALERINYIFDEFENVIVAFSGGKDSTVTLNLALQVAEERGRLPLSVVFIDQEAEWQTVIDYVRTVMDDPRVTPMWMQMPIKIFNSTSTIDTWLQCWEEGKEWIRDKEPDAIKENVYGSDRFKELFGKIIDYHYPGQKACYLGGVRAEESPARTLSLTQTAKYKDITWGKRTGKKDLHYTFYPLYDWSYTDIWKSIHDNNWDYCKIYDYMYQQGVRVQDMRVSNVHHETAVHALFYLQEIEPENWNKLTKRIAGINTAGHLQKLNFFIPKELPYMFQDWKEYRDYLTDHLVTDDKIRDIYHKKFAEMDEKYKDMHHKEVLYREHINTIMTNDYHFTKLSNFEARPDIAGFRRFNKGKFHPMMKTNKYIVG